MASPSTEAPLPPPTIRDVMGHDDDDDYSDHTIAEEEEGDEEEEEEWDMSKRMSRLSLEGSDGGDADDEAGGDEEEQEEDGFEVPERSDVNAATAYRAWPPYENPQQAPSSASLPGTPDRGAQAAGWPGASAKEYASETEARWPPGADGRGGRRQRQHQRRWQRMGREAWLERAWRMRKQRRQLQEEVVPVVVLGGGGDSPASRGGVAMDMEEVRACRDLGLDLPCDWTVEIPTYYALSGVDTASSGGNSPASAGSWRISSPGDDPKDVKARLKVWAQVVALASASRLGS